MDRVKGNNREWQDTLGLVTAWNHHIPIPGRACGQEPLAEDSSQGQPEPTQQLAERDTEKQHSFISVPPAPTTHWL